MKKVKETIKKNLPSKKKVSAKNIGRTSNTKSTVKNGGEQDFGGIKKINSSTEKRKNVNADPNLIQSNFLYDDDEQMLDL